MKKEEINELAKLLTRMKDANSRLEEAKSRADLVSFKRIKQEIIEIKNRIDQMI